MGLYFEDLEVDQQFESVGRCWSLRAFRKFGSIVYWSDH